MIAVGEMAGHTHTRGTMNITGTVSNDGGAGLIGNLGSNLPKLSGAFVKGSNTYSWRSSTSQESGADLGFDASKSWSGETSSTGSDTKHNNVPAYIACYAYKRKK